MATSPVGVAAPPLRVPQRGLVAVAEVIGAPVADWVRGVTFTPEPGGADLHAGVFNPCGGQAAQAPPARRSLGVFTPFVVDFADRCSSFGWQAADYEGRARRALEVRESWRVENVLEHGSGFVNEFSLDDNTHDRWVALNGGAATQHSYALKLLVDAIADADVGLGMIHAPSAVVEGWKGAGHLEVNAGRLVTANGVPVVAGNGYDGIGPGPTGGRLVDGATSMWAYATDTIQLLRDPDIELTPGTLAEAMDRQTNVITYRASRVWAYTWNGLLHAGVQVAVPVPTP